MIPELQWKNFYVADMKNVYLISDSTENRESGMCYFNLNRFFDEKK
jgi:hypothetical protein